MTDSFLAFAADGSVTVYTSKVDVGTGLRIALSQMVAEELEVPLDKVNNVNFRQTIFQRLLGTGELEIDSGESTTVVVHKPVKGTDSDDEKSGTEVNGGTTKIAHVRRPEFVQNTIHKAMNARATGTFRPAPSHGDVADQLERLEALRDRGALTDEEFDQQKRRLLG